MKKAVVFDMDECIGSFWSLWPLYDLYYDGDISDINKIIHIGIKTVLPTCLRPNLYYLFHFIHTLKLKKKINNVFLYTNNGNYKTIKEKKKKKDKLTFPHFIIKSIEIYFKLPGFFDLILETIFIRQRDAKNNIKEKFIDDLIKHGYEQTHQVIIFDDNFDTWKTGSKSVVQVDEFRGASHGFKNIDNLCKLIYKNLSQKSIYKSENEIKHFIHVFLKNEYKGKLTNLQDKEIINKCFPSLLHFVF